jgi:hypothetical protein
MEKENTKNIFDLLDVDIPVYLKNILIFCGFDNLSNIEFLNKEDLTEMEIHIQKQLAPAIKTNNTLIPKFSPLSQFLVPINQRATMVKPLSVFQNILVHLDSGFLAFPSFAKNAGPDRVADD